MPSHPFSPPLKPYRIAQLSTTASKDQRANNNRSISKDEAANTDTGHSAGTIIATGSFTGTLPWVPRSVPHGAYSFDSSGLNTDEDSSITSHTRPTFGFDITPPSIREGATTISPLSTPAYHEPLFDTIIPSSQHSTRVNSQVEELEEPILSPPFPPQPRKKESIPLPTQIPIAAQAPLPTSLEYISEPSTPSMPVDRGLRARQMRRLHAHFETTDPTSHLLGMLKPKVLRAVNIVEKHYPGQEDPHEVRWPAKWLNNMKSLRQAITWMIKWAEEVETNPELEVDSAPAVAAEQPKTPPSAEAHGSSSKPQNPRTSPNAEKQLSPPEIPIRSVGKTGKDGQQTRISLAKTLPEWNLRPELVPRVDGTASPAASTINNNDLNNNQVDKLIPPQARGKKSHKQKRSVDPKALVDTAAIETAAAKQPKTKTKTRPAPDDRGRRPDDIPIPKLYLKFLSRKARAQQQKLVDEADKMQAREEMAEREYEVNNRYDDQCWENELKRDQKLEAQVQRDIEDEENRQREEARRQVEAPESDRRIQDWMRNQGNSHD